MSKFTISQATPSKRFAWLAAFLCIACCAIVPILVLLGVASAASLGIYFEFASAGFFIASLIAFGYLLFKNKNQYCKTDCECKDTSA